MNQAARNAFNALKKLNAPIYDRSEYGAAFILGGELRTADDTYFADYYQEEVKEGYDPNDKTKIINAFGIRQDVHDILTKFGCHAEWINPSMVGIYGSAW